MNYTDRGFSLVEVLLALALVSLAVAGFLSAMLYADGIAGALQPRIQARLYAGECLEALRWIRDADGLDALDEGTFGLDRSDGRWTLAASPDTQGGFIRQAQVEPYDDDSKLLTCTVDWNDGSSQSMAVTTLLAR